MSAAQALDEATTALYEQVRNAPANRELIAALAAGANAPAPDAAACARFCFVLVPGIFYRDYPHTGADGAVLKEIAAKLPIPVVTVPLDGTEGRDAAIDTLCSWLRSEVPADKTAVLVSLSKGSAEVLYALSNPAHHAAFARVTAWVSVSGLPLGTPVLEAMLRNPLRRLFIGAFFALKRWKLQVLRDLLRYRPELTASLPQHMQFIQVAAFPLHRHLNDRRSRRLHLQLAPLGPNDGFAPLAAMARLPGLMYPMWGADHYLRGGEDLPSLIRSLLAYVVLTR